jgi:hypothetical protein
MLAHKLSPNPPHLSARLIEPPPVETGRTHLMLVRTPQATPRALAWARHRRADAFDPLRLQSMLRSERLNLG